MLTFCNKTSKHAHPAGLTSQKKTLNKKCGFHTKV